MAGAPITAAMVARSRTIGDPRVSPDGRRVVFVSDRRLVLVPTPGGPEVSVPVDPPPATPHPAGGGVVDWAGDELVYVAADGSVRAVSADGGPVRVVAAEASAWSVAVSPDARQVAYVVDQHEVRTAPVDGSARPVLRSHGAAFAMDPTWAPDSAGLAWHEWDEGDMPWDRSRIGVDDWPGGAAARGEAVAQPRGGPDGTLGYLTDASGWMGLWCLTEGHEHGSPAWGPGIRQWAWSPDSQRVAFVRNEGGFGRLCVLDRGRGEVTELGRGWHHGLSWSAGALCAVRTGARTPAELVVYDDGGARRVLAGTIAVPRDALVEPEPVTWGAGVHGRLYAGRKGRPLLLWVHGGPSDQTRVEFHGVISWFVARGWAVLAPDHRGSTGWGRAYRTAMDGGWGEVDVADCAEGLRAAAAAGWGDGSAAVAYGASAGGFTVLHLAARHPGLLAAAVVAYPVVDLLGLNEQTHRFERRYNDVLVGTDPTVLAARSPLHHASRLDTPVLVLHGDADEVVPVGQSRALAAAAATVELHVYEGEGHGFRRPETVEDQLARVEDFLRRHVVR